MSMIALLRQSCILYIVRGGLCVAQQHLRKGRPRGILSHYVNHNWHNDFLYGSVKVKKTSKQQNPQLTAQVNRLVCKACSSDVCSQESTLLWSPSNTTMLSPAAWAQLQQNEKEPRSFCIPWGNQVIAMQSCNACKAFDVCHHVENKMHMATGIRALCEEDTRCPSSKGTCLNHCQQVLICCKYLNNAGFP